MKLWQKNYKTKIEIERFTIGDDYILDKKLIKFDCLGSIAHAKMLKKIGILTNAEAKKIITILNEIIKEEIKGNFSIKPEDEDCHTAIENYLTNKLGDIGKKIHTARSRNDQVLTDLRLFYKNKLRHLNKLLVILIEKLKIFIKKYGQIKIPGYSHMQKAMPSSLGLWAESFVESMKDNIDLINFVHGFIDKCPLGTGAGYGIPLQIDRDFVSKALGFKGVQINPIYVQNSRGKFESIIINSLGQIMFDLNKMAMDLLFFSLKEIGYINIPDELCTGSSIMPHKKNPDVIEMVRAKYHQILSNEVEIKSMISNLISGYNRDIQLTKKTMFESFEIVEESILVTNIVIENIGVNKEICERAMSQELYSTDRVYELVKKGIPFRDAYIEVSRDYQIFA
jgi:argininosuccinate lyase